MRVVLLQNLKALGVSGQTVDVPEGYAVSFLFPEHLAAPALHAEERNTNSEKRTDHAQQELAASLDGLEVIVERKVKNGAFVAPITTTDIIKSVKSLGYRLQPEWMRNIRLQEPGNVEIPVQFPAGYEAILSVIAQPA